MRLLNCYIPFYTNITHKYNPSALSDLFAISTHRYTTRLRQNSNFSIIKPKTVMEKKSLKFFGVKLWIRRPVFLKEISEPKKFNFKFKKLNFLNFSLSFVERTFSHLL